MYERKKKDSDFDLIYIWVLKKKDKAWKSPLILWWLWSEMKSYGKDFMHELWKKKKGGEIERMSNRLDAM